MTTNQSASELKSCPFCGSGVAEVFEDNSYSFYCKGCGVFTEPYGIREELVTAWNKRASQKPTDTDRADANKKLKHAKFRLIDARDKINNSIEDIIDIECASLTQKPTDTDRADALDWLEAGRDKIYTKDELDIIYPTIRASLTQKDASVLVEALELCISVMDESGRDASMKELTDAELGKMWLTVVEKAKQVLDK